MIKGRFNYDKEELIEYWNKVVEPLLLRTFKEEGQLQLFRAMFNPKRYPNDEHNELIYNSLYNFMGHVRDRYEDALGNGGEFCICRFYPEENKPYTFPLSLTFNSILHLYMVFVLLVMSHFKNICDDDICDMSKPVLKAFLGKRTFIDKVKRIIETIKEKY